MKFKNLIAIKKLAKIIKHKFWPEMEFEVVLHKVFLSLYYRIFSYFKCSFLNNVNVKYVNVDNKNK